MHTVRCQEAVFNALTQAVGVNGFTEICVSIAVVIPRRHGSHSQLGGGLEILQDLSPVAFVTGASTARPRLLDQKNPANIP